MFTIYDSHLRHPLNRKERKIIFIPEIFIRNNNPLSPPLAKCNRNSIHILPRHLAKIERVLAIHFQFVNNSKRNMLLQAVFAIEFQKDKKEKKTLLEQLVEFGETMPREESNHTVPQGSLARTSLKPQKCSLCHSPALVSHRLCSECRATNSTDRQHKAYFHPPLHLVLMEQEQSKGPRRNNNFSSTKIIWSSFRTR